ncbi:MAG: adenylate/guanylate cyclase domain-containing protein [Ignavibacteria bacterium]|nr:adenylate/guanylate cyclase domain-containing protein [Ignavibacteria bacterium]
MNIPTGTVTFLFTDIEGSTKLSQDYPETYHSILTRHNEILHEAVESNSGFVFKTVGDAFCCAFQNAEDAVKAAVDAQINFNSENRKNTVVKVRIGIHTGNAEWNEKDYMGYITLARTSRVMSAAYGGQILATEKVYELTEWKTVTGISFRDLGERRLKDLIQPVKLFQILSQGLTSDFPPLKTLDARPNNLPVQLTNFIGREKEIIEIKNLLSEFRHITMLGPGGTGKTRLALQVAADLIDEFSNGVWVIELAPLFDPLLVPSAFVRTLGITEPPGQDTLSTLVNYLKDKEILLILDNSEHLINACANITEKLLKNCCGLKIIVTSREALRSDGEYTYRVTSLRHPQPKETNTLQELSQFEAVRLFIERALAVNSGFRVNNENAPALAEICYQLDGIPLAIELAAARIKILSVEKICEKLNDRFKLLTSGKRTALPRQQTLRAMIDWSYDLLTDKEKILFQRLSVFSGGWTLEAAEEVCSDDNIESYEIIDTHTNLLDKSLISSTETSGNIRFYMLESLKQYAIEKLGTDSVTAVKHLNYFMKLADHEQMRKDGMEVIDWVNLIDSEIDNIRTAIHRASENNPDEAFIIVNNMTEFWNVKGSFLEGLQTCLKVLDTKLEYDEILKARVLYSAGLDSSYLGRQADS